MINVIEVYQSKETGELQKNIVDLFCGIAKVLNIDFAPFIPLILEQFKRNKRVSEKFNSQIEDITKIDLVDLFKKNLGNEGNETFEEIVFGTDEVAGGRSNFANKKNMMQ